MARRRVPDRGTDDCPGCPRTPPRPDGCAGAWPRPATAALLAIDAYVHFNDAGLYDIGAGAAITQGSLFRAQASIAVVVAIALLVRPHWIVWTVAVLVAASAATTVYLYTSVDVGRLGPLPDLYDPTWALPGKRASALAETVATGLSTAGLVATLWTRTAPAVKTMNTSSGASRRRLPSPCTGHRQRLDPSPTACQASTRARPTPQPGYRPTPPRPASAPRHSSLPSCWALSPSRPITTEPALATPSTLPRTPVP